MHSRKRFEEWFHSRYASISMPPQDRMMLFVNQWAAWQASRAAIEIELPSGATKDDERLSCETSHEGSFNLCLHHASNAIRAAGIKVKGD